MKNVSFSNNEDREIKKYESTWNGKAKVERRHIATRTAHWKDAKGTTDVNLNVINIVHINDLEAALKLAKKEYKNPEAYIYVNKVYWSKPTVELFLKTEKKKKKYFDISDEIQVLLEVDKLVNEVETQEAKPA